MILKNKKEKIKNKIKIKIKINNNNNNNNALQKGHEVQSRCAFAPKTECGCLHGAVG